MLTNPYIIAVVVPLLLMGCGAFAKKLVRSTDFQRSDFFLGIDLSLSAMASGLINISDLIKSAVINPTNAVVINSTKSKIMNVSVDSLEKILETGVFLVLCFFLFLIILGLHQTWEKPIHANTKNQLIMLGIVSNFMGISLMVFFILSIKGIN